MRIENDKVSLDHGRVRIGVAPSGRILISVIENGIVLFSAFLSNDDSDDLRELLLCHTREQRAETAADAYTSMLERLKRGADYSRELQRQVKENPHIPPSYRDKLEAAYRPGNRVVMAQSSRWHPGATGVVVDVSGDGSLVAVAFGAEERWVSRNSIARRAGDIA